MKIKKIVKILFLFYHGDGGLCKNEAKKFRRYFIITLAIKYYIENMAIE